jgi:hypothetical protein
MIDPITALAGIQSAVALIKKVSKTVDDVSSLGPVLGKYFDAKSNATKAVVQAKNSGKKSSMAAAVEIEMAIHQAEEFEKELQFLFMQTGKIDVWLKIKSRAQSMDIEAAHQARRDKEAAARQRRKNQEMIEIVFSIFLVVVVLFGIVWGTIEFVQYCKEFHCGK